MFRTSLVTRIHSLKLSALNKQFVSHQAFGWESKGTVSECKRRLNGKGIRNKQILVHREYPHSFLPYDARVCKGEGEGRGRRRRKARRLKCAQPGSAWTCFSLCCRASCRPEQTRWEQEGFVSARTQPFIHSHRKEKPCEPRRGDRSSFGAVRPSRKTGR